MKEMFGIAKACEKTKMSKIKVLGYFGFLVFFRDETKEVFGFRKHAKRRNWCEKNDKF